MNTKTQQERILNRLLDLSWHSSLELRFELPGDPILMVPTRIFELKKAGYLIDSKTGKTNAGTDIAYYRLRQLEPILAGQQVEMAI